MDKERYRTQVAQSITLFFVAHLVVVYHLLGINAHEKIYFLA